MPTIITIHKQNLVESNVALCPLLLAIVYVLMAHASHGGMTGAIACFNSSGLLLSLCQYSMHVEALAAFFEQRCVRGSSICSDNLAGWAWNKGVMKSLTYAFGARSVLLLFFEYRLLIPVPTFSTTEYRSAFLDILYFASARVDVKEAVAHNAECCGFVLAEVCV